MAKITRHRFTVRLSHVPFDMLRYDHCWPATEQESNKLLNLSLEHDGPIEVVFETDNPHAPTVGRWQSFVCRVVDGSIVKVW